MKVLNGLFFVAYSHGAGMVDWITHQLVASVLHGLIFAFMFKLMRALTLPQAMVLVAVVVGAVYLVGRSRDRRGW